MLNRFLAIGDLQEIRIDLFKTHIKIRLSIAIDKTKIITCQQTISKKWDGVKSWYGIIPLLHPRIDGYVYVNNQRYYTMKKLSSTTKLLVSGNVNEYKKSLYYNMQYCRIEQDNAQSGLSIEIDGQWIDNERMVNLSGEWARLFNVAAPLNYEKRLYRLKLDYCNGAICDGDKVEFAPYGLQVIDYRPLDEYIDDEQMKNIMLEIEVTS